MRGLGTEKLSQSTLARRGAVDVVLHLVSLCIEGGWMKCARVHDVLSIGARQLFKPPSSHQGLCPGNGCSEPSEHWALQQPVGRAPGPPTDSTTIILIVVLWVPRANRLKGFRACGERVQPGTEKGHARVWLACGGVRAI